VIPQASVIVPARNAQETLPRTLATLADQEVGIDYEVVVVDDGSTDRTAAAARSARGPVRVISEAPSGPAAACNRGDNAMCIHLADAVIESFGNVQIARGI